MKRSCKYSHGIYKWKEQVHAHMRKKLNGFLRSLPTSYPGSFHYAPPCNICPFSCVLMQVLSDLKVIIMKILPIMGKAHFKFRKRGHFHSRKGTVLRGTLPDSQLSAASVENTTMIDDQQRLLSTRPDLHL